MSNMNKPYEVSLLGRELDADIRRMDEAQAGALLKEFNWLPLEENPQPSHLKSRVKNALFYTVLVAFVTAAFLYSNGTAGSARGPRDWFGYSVMLVLSGSMHSVMPEDSLIVTHRVDPAKIEVGDDIAFLRQDGETVTHRVIEIVDSFSNTGKRGFRTQGTENPSPDKETVGADNVIGKVVFHNYPIGRAVVLLRSNLLLIAIAAVMAALAIGFLAALKYARKDKPPRRARRGKITV